jgi:hypothetical protein
VCSKYAIYQKVIVEKRAPPIFNREQMHPKLVDLIGSCHQFEPAARPTFPDVLRVLREVQDEIEEEQMSSKKDKRAESPNA